MKKIAIILLPVLLFACASKKDASITLSGNPVVESSCPPEGKCTVTLHNDKSLLVKKDGIDKLYYELTDNPGTVVISYAYNKTKNPEYQDDFYSEEILFESDTALSNLKEGKVPDIYFTVNCFCRGKQGTYKVNGAQALFKDDKLQITLPQIIDNQLTKQITIAFK